MTCAWSGTKTAGFTAFLRRAARRLQDRATFPPPSPAAASRAPGTWCKWERLPDSRRNSLHQRNCVLHPEFVDGKYAFYTRPMTDFAATGTGDGIGWGLCDDITNAVD